MRDQGKGGQLNDFTSLLKQAGKGQVKVQTCWVVAKSIDWPEKTMTATGVTDDLDFYDINLGSGSIYTKPKVGSICLIGIIQNNDAASFLIDAEEIEEYSLSTNSTSFKLDLNGIEIKKGNETLKKILSDLIDSIQLIGAYKDTGGLTLIKTRIGSLLK